MTRGPLPYAVMADENNRLNVYRTKAQAQRYLTECVAYAKTQGRWFGGFIARWSGEAYEQEVDQ